MIKRDVKVNIQAILGWNFLATTFLLPYIFIWFLGKPKLSLLFNQWLLHINKGKIAICFTSASCLISCICLKPGISSRLIKGHCVLITDTVESMEYLLVLCSWFTVTGNSMNWITWIAKDRLQNIYEEISKYLYWYFFK